MLTDKGFFLSKFHFTVFSQIQCDENDYSKSGVQLNEETTGDTAVLINHEHGNYLLLSFLIFCLT